MQHLIKRWCDKSWKDEQFHLKVPPVHIFISSLSTPSPSLFLPGASADPTARLTLALSLFLPMPMKPESKISPSSRNRRDLQSSLREWQKNKRWTLVWELINTHKTSRRKLRQEKPPAAQLKTGANIHCEANGNKGPDTQSDCPAFAP